METPTQPQPAPVAPMPPAAHHGRSNFALVFSDGRKFTLIKEKAFYRKDIPELAPSTGDPAVAVVRENPDHPEIVGIMNCSRTKWSADMPGGVRKEIEPGKSIRLVEGMVLNFGKIMAQVQPASGGSVFFARFGKALGVGGAALLIVAVLLFALLKPTGAAQSKGPAPVDFPALVKKAEESVICIVTDRQTSGTGFFITADGQALTNCHVVENDAEVTAIFPDGKKIRAKVLKRDPILDVALIKVPGTYPFLELDPTDPASKKGVDVFALGYPVPDLVQSFTDSSASRGSISGMRPATAIYQNAKPDQQLIQTDTSINHGNSGGPLIEVSTGKVVGITSAGIRNDGHSTEAFTGLNFAIPISEVQAKFLAK